MLWLLLACSPHPNEHPPAAGEDSATDSATAPDTGPWRSALYPEDWVPGQGEDDWRLPDFSYAGYHNGEAEPPDQDGPGNHHSAQSGEHRFP